MVNILLKDHKFIIKYINELQRVSQPIYLDKIFAKIENTLNEKLSIIYKDFPYYNYPKQYLYNFQRVIQNTLLKKSDLRVYGSIELDSISFENHTNIPFLLDDIFLNGNKVNSFSSKIIINLN